MAYFSRFPDSQVVATNITSRFFVMTWWRMLLDSPAQLAIIAGVSSAIVALPVFFLGWHIRGWWISKRPDGPLIVTIRKQAEEKEELLRRTVEAEEKARRISAYATQAARHFAELAGG